MHRASPGYAQTIMQLEQQADGSVALGHGNLVMPAHQAMCLAFVLQAMAQKRMQHQQLPPGSHSDAIVQLGLQRPLSVHDLGTRKISLELSVAVIGELCSAQNNTAAVVYPVLLHLHTARCSQETGRSPSRRPLCMPATHMRQAHMLTAQVQSYRGRSMRAAHGFAASPAKSHSGCGRDGS